MATGITERITKEKISFRDFALICAWQCNWTLFRSAMGLEMDSPIPDSYKPSREYEGKIQEARDRLQKARDMSKDEVRAEAENFYDIRLRDYANGLVLAAKTIEGYVSMREQVRKWEPPTKDHVGVKKFMLEQLDGSISTDSYFLEKGVPEKLDGEKYRERIIQEAKRNIESSIRHDSSLQDRVNRTNTWIKQLKDSLPEEKRKKQSRKDS